MGEKDISEKTLTSYNDVFADIVNGFLFEGREVIKQDDLVDANVTSVYKADGKLHEQERDVAKYWKNGSIRLAFCGVEHQTSIDKDMPLRVISYDGSVYRAQLNTDDSECSLRYPVVTLVLYFGDSKWNKYKSLLECLDISEAIKPYVNDYKINVFDVKQMTIEQLNRFKSDFKILAEYFVQQRLTNKYVPSNIPMQHPDEVLKLFSVLTGDVRFENSINELKGRSDVTMSPVIDAMVEKGIRKGIQKGKMQILVSLINDGTLSKSDAAKKVEMTLEEFEKKLAEFNS